MDEDVVPLAANPDVDSYLAPRLPGEPRPALLPRELFVRSAASRVASPVFKGKTSFPTVHAVKRARTLIDVEADWIRASMPAPLSQARFLTFTAYPMPRDRLVKLHQRWTEAVEAFARERVCQYRALDQHLSGEWHIHLLLFGARQVRDEVLWETWRVLTRIPKGQAAHCLDSQPATSNALYYCAMRAVQRGERDVDGPWPVCTTEIAEPDETALQRELKALRRSGRRPGRPVCALIDALWWLQCVFSTGESYLVSDLRRAIVGQEFSFKTLRRAKEMLGVSHEKRGRRDWLWSSPSVNSAQERRQDIPVEEVAA